MYKYLKLLSILILIQFASCGDSDNLKSIGSTKYWQFKQNTTDYQNWLSRNGFCGTTCDNFFRSGPPIYPQNGAQSPTQTENNVVEITPRGTAGIYSSVKAEQCPDEQTAQRIPYNGDSENNVFFYCQLAPQVY